MTELLLDSVEFIEGEHEPPAGYLDFRFEAGDKRASAVFNVRVATKGNLGEAEKAARGFVLRLIRELAAEPDAGPNAGTDE